MNEEEKKALRVINTRTRRLLDELEIEKEDMSDEPRIAYLMQEIRANKTILNLIEKLQKENESWKSYSEEIEEEQTEMNNKNCELEFEVEKLQKENEELKNQEATARKINELLVERYSTSIPVQKVKDKIEEYKNILKTCNKSKDVERIKAINERVLELEELLENDK